MRRGTNYGRTVLWTVRDTFRAEPKRFLASLLLGGLSLAMQALAVLVIFSYSQKIQLDQRFTVLFLNIDWAARTDVAFLLWTIAAFAVSLSAAVLLNFASQRLVLSIVRRSLARSIERLARAVKVLPDPRAPVASRLSSEQGFNQLNGGLVSSARGPIVIVQTIPALAGAALAGAALFWMEPWLSAILVAVTAAWSALLYPAALRAVRFERDLRRTSGTVRRDYASVTAAPDNWRRAEDLSRSYLGRLETQAEMGVVVGIGIAVIVAIATYVMGAEMMSGGQSWPMLIAYVGGLQVALNGVFRTVRAMAVISRHYTQMVRTRQFVRDLNHLTAPTGRPARGQLVSLGRDPDGEPVCAEIGERLAVVSRQPMERIQLSALRAHDGNGLPVRSLRRARGAARLRSEDPPILFMDVRILSEEIRLRKLDERDLVDRLLIVVHPTPDTVGSVGEDRLVILEGGWITGFAALGSEAASEAMRSIEQQTRSDRPPERDDEDDL